MARDCVACAYSRVRWNNASLYRQAYCKKAGSVLAGWNDAMSGGPDSWTPPPNCPLDGETDEATTGESQTA